MHVFFNCPFNIRSLIPLRNSTTNRCSVKKMSSFINFCCTFLSNFFFQLYCFVGIYWKYYFVTKKVEGGGSSCMQNEKDLLAKSSSYQSIFSLVRSFVFVFHAAIDKKGSDPLHGARSLVFVVIQWRRWSPGSRVYSGHCWRHDAQLSKRLQWQGRMFAWSLSM